MTLLQLFWSFLQVGLFSIGGGYAAMPLIQSQVVETHGWLTMSEFTDLITIAEMTPGPIAINSATFVGIRIAGIRGAVVGAQMTKGNRSAQTFFVNERYIHSKQLSAALESAYGVSLMQHRFPIAALDIDIPPNSVDINISPNKLRARFHHERAVLQAVRQGAMQALRDGSPGVFDVPAPASPAPKARIVLSDADAQTAGTRTADAATIEKAPAAKAVAAPMQAPPEAGGRPIEASAGTLRAHAGVLDVSGRAAGLPLGGYPNEARPASARDLSSDRPQGVGDASAKNSSSASAGPEGGARPKPLQQQMRAPEEAQLPAYRILGQLHNTYVVLEVEDGMLLIDQHAAHERMKYDALMEQAERGGVAEQQLLIPARLKLTPQEYTRMQSLLESLNALGFRARLCDDYTLEVDTLPMVLGHPDAQDLLTVLREDLYAIEKSAQMRTQQIAKMACKAAVRGGDRLSAMELQQLLRRLARSEYHLTCPHGRPIAVSFSKRDLEKLFKRIV